MKRLLVGLLACMALPAAAEVPLADFARNDSFSEATISPDGRFVALKVPIGSQKGVAVFDIAKRKLISKTSMGADRSVLSYWWAGPNRLVVSLAEDFGYHEAPESTGELYALNADGSDGAYLFGYRGSRGEMDTRLSHETAHRGSAEVIRTLPDDPDHVLIGVRDWGANKDYGIDTAYRIDVHTGKLSEGLAAPISGLVGFAADAKGFVRYAIGRDEHYNTRTFVRSPENPSWVTLNTGELRKANIYPFTFGLSNDNSAAFLSSDEGEDRQCLVRVDLRTGDRKKLSCDDVSSLSGAVMSFDGDEPVAAIYESGIPEVRLLDTKNPARDVLMKLEAAFPGQVTIPVSRTKDGKQAIVEVYSDRNPGDFYLFDTQTLDAQYLVGADNWINPEQMAERRPVTYAARDGQAIRGYLTIPQGKQARTLPLVVNPHGGPFFQQDRWGWDRDAQALASRGYAVLQVNYRGSGGFGNKFVEAGKHGWDSVMIDDITDGARWAISQGYADPARICVFGVSYGGYAALMSAVREPDLYRCVVDYAGVADLERQQRDTDSTLTIQGRNYYEDFVGADAKRLRAASPLTYIDRLKAALMIVHGKDDKRVPYSQATELRDALDKRHYPYEWLVKSGEGHGFYNPDNRREFYEKLIAFLNRNIGPGAVAADAASPAAAPTAEAK